VPLVPELNEEDKTVHGIKADHFEEIYFLK
jgi:hypothetical protein